MNKAIVSFVLSFLFLGSDAQAMTQEGSNPLYTKSLIVCGSVGFAVGIFSLGYWFGKSVEAKKQSVINQGLTQNYQKSLGEIYQQKSENAFLKKEIYSLEGAKMNLRTENITLTSKIVDLEHKWLQLQIKNSSLRSECRRFKDQNKSLLSRLETLSYLARSYKRLFERSENLLKACDKKNILLHQQLQGKICSKDSR